uniref:Uncharacterized protein n=1 Tax=Siphoviridae sp. ctNs77 TaxID=2825473 RepID=A0A8S5QHM0_9CAUD|nr:MAG TPA: hypothetical protein [Siphoviridae sp. ctNs77]DAI04191.1 MAG TPA: hypothetical protein [Caudoviricetes sp.]DAJ30522.1 MAG TPA: hypothetical protein [Caudoviricetes sp.]
MLKYKQKRQVSPVTKNLHTLYIMIKNLSQKNI